MLPQKQRAIVIALIGLGLVIVGFFGLRAARAFREFHGYRPPPPFATEPHETDVELVRDWMTIPFISKMYNVQPRTLFEAVGIPEQGNRDKSLRQLNDEYFPEVRGIVEAKIKAALLENLSPDTPVTP